MRKFSGGMVVSGPGLINHIVFREKLPIVGDGSKMQTIRLKRAGRPWEVGNEYTAYWKLRVPHRLGGSERLYRAVVVGLADLRFIYAPHPDHSLQPINPSARFFSLSNQREWYVVKDLLDWSIDGIVHEDGFPSIGDLLDWFTHRYPKQIWDAHFEVIKYDFCVREFPNLSPRPGQKGFEQYFKMHILRPSLKELVGGEPYRIGGHYVLKLNDGAYRLLDRQYKTIEDMTAEDLAQEFPGVWNVLEQCGLTEDGSECRGNLK